MRNRSLLAITFAGLGIFATACGGHSDKPPATNSAYAQPPISPTTSSSPSTTAYPALKDADFIAYKRDPKRPNTWVSDGTFKKMPTLVADDYNVTSFTLNGVTCEVRMYSLQLTPARAGLMATTAKMFGLKEGKFNFRSGKAILGSYVCRRA